MPCIARARYDLAPTLDTPTGKDIQKQLNSGGWAVKALITCRNLIMLIAYQSIVILAMVLLGPFLLLRKKSRAGIWQKLGLIPKEIVLNLANNLNPIWFHAVSVGEFNAIWPVIEQLHNEYPEQAIVVSTATETGQNLAKSRAGHFATIIYFPFDLIFCISPWLKAIAPKLVLIAETELWPMFLDKCRKSNIPCVLINGRMSPKSFRSYYRWRFFFGPVIRNYAAIGVQSENEAMHYRQVAGDHLPLYVTGNLKFDGIKTISADAQANLRKKLAISANDLVIVGGSTHEGEESMLITAIAALSENSKPLRLIIVPRHPERFNRAAQLIEAAGYRPRRFSKGEFFEEKRDIYLLDAIGHLSDFYSIANVAFVGGTIAPIGGHNIAEPYAYGVAVICGPHIEKTREVAKALLAVNAISIVTEKEFVGELSHLLSHSEKRQEMGARGFNWLKQSQGAVVRTLAMIENILQSSNNSSNNKPGSISAPLVSPKIIGNSQYTSNLKT
jgi:3-deoxy-D-manno-octulosonic-acid transferase